MMKPHKAIVWYALAVLFASFLVLLGEFVPPVKKAIQVITKKFQRPTLAQRYRKHKERRKWNNRAKRWVRKKHRAIKVRWNLFRRKRKVKID